MNTWTTPINNTGRVINGKTLIELQGLISRVSPLFGVTVLAVKTPTGLDPINADQVKSEIDQIAKRRRRGFVVEADTPRFINLCNKAGVTMSIGPAVVDAVAGLAAGSITNTGVTLSCTAYVPEDAAPDLTYVFYVYAAGVQVATGSSATPSKAITGLTTGTAYTAKVKATWNGGASYTPLSAAINFSTI